MTVRAKFKVQSVQDATDRDGKLYSQAITMVPVYSSDPNHENRAFWQATPSGSLVMWVNNPAVFGALEVDQEYYLDFTKAE